MYSLEYYIIHTALSIGFLQILIGLFARSEKLAACNLVRIQRSDTASHDAKNFLRGFSSHKAATRVDDFAKTKLVLPF